MLRKLSVAVVSGFAASTVLTLSPPAIAADDEPRTRIVLRDPARDVWAAENGDEEPTKTANRRADVRRAVVNHRRHALAVRMRFADLRRVGEQTYIVEIVTPDETFGALIISERGQRRGYLHLETADESRCPSSSHKIDYAKDLVTMRIARSCLGSPAWVRVNITNYLAMGGSLFGEDWDRIYLDNPHSTRWRGGYTPRLQRG